MLMEFKRHSLYNAIIEFPQGEFIVISVIEVNKSLAFLDENVQRADFLLEKVIDGLRRVELQRGSNHKMYI